jgi:hypothetical protein
VEVLAMERMEKTGEDLGIEARTVWKPPTIGSDETALKAKTFEIKVDVSEITVPIKL